jgi:hypothetical protein
VRSDWRRRILQLPPFGDLSQGAVRAAYWRLLAAKAATGQTLDRERLRVAKQQLLFEAGLRVPVRGR